jgi:D-lactate dehydrogenase (cytochrome)
MPFQKQYPFYVMIELISPTENDGVEALTEFLSNASEQISDACIPKSITQAQELWKIRESICDAFIKEGKTWVYDISVPLDNAYEIVEGTRSRLNGGVVCGYAHLGDNNVHLNVTINNGSVELEKRIETEVEPYIYAFTSKLNGSINAEHGIGVAKKKQLKIYKPGNSYALQKSLKKLMDPNNILNPNIYLI